jgi:hypothetical protein
MRRRAGFKIVYYTGASLIHVGSVSLSKVAHFNYLKMLYANLMRFRLLYYRAGDIVPSLIEMVLMCFLRRVDNTKPLGRGNLAFQIRPGAHLYCFTRALIANLRQLSSIMRRRVHDSSYVAASNTIVGDSGYSSG